MLRHSLQGGLFIYLVCLCLCTQVFADEDNPDCRNTSYATTLLPSLLSANLHALSEFEFILSSFPPQPLASIMSTIMDNNNGFFLGMHAAWATTGNYIGIIGCQTVFANTTECVKASTRFVLKIANVCPSQCPCSQRFFFVSHSSATIGFGATP